MAKQYKIKRGQKIRSTYRAAPHPLTVLLALAGAALLIFVGISIYEPVYNFIMNLGRGIEPQTTQESSAPEDNPVSEPAEEEQSASEPEPEPAPPSSVDELRTAYLPSSAAVSPAALEAFLSRLPQEINAVLFDAKNSQGQLAYRSSDPRALEWEAVAENALELSDLSKTLNDQGYHLVTRMHTFSDPICARGDREKNAVKFQGSDMLWLDNFADQGGKPWSNPYEAGVRSYLVELAAEQARLGAVMVVLDGVRFPDDMTGSATFGDSAAGISRSAILTTFLSEVKGALEPMGVRYALQLPATAINHISKAGRYGGNPLALGAENIVLSILPEELSTGYLAEGVIVTRPALNPAATVSETLGYAKSQSTGEVTLIPLLRGRETGEPALTREQLASQLEAAKASAGQEYFLYSPDGSYAAE